MSIKLKLLIIAFVTLTVASIAFAIRSSKPAEASYDEFAKCLASKQVTMYGAVWCPACQKQKKEFGTSFKYVPYVECPDDPQKCIAQGIEAYPTWEFPSGEKIVGVQTFETLSAKSGCTLPATAK
jgi:hypothetical protein